MSKLGIDFDNTLVSYDAVFHEVALDRGLISLGVPCSKEMVRNHLRAINRENDWTLLQGYVYGACMHRATLFEGATTALKSLAQSGWEIVIVSHKTKTPFLGPAYDLHAAAQDFLRAQQLLHPHGPIVRAYFETSKEAKIDRIARENCDAFVDDLPEILQMPGFPDRTRRLLFAPNADEVVSFHELLRVGSWMDVPTILREAHE
jgi:hypothetical protein